MFTGSIVALITPFGENQKIDYAVVKNLIELHVLEKSDAIVIGGTTGEGPTLDNEEFKELLAFAIKESAGKIPIIAGTGSNCTRKTVKTTTLAKEMGADGALLILPYYNKPTDRGVLAHFREVSKVQIPFIPYHHPGRCGIELDVETLIELSRYDYVVGIKECSKNQMALRELLEKRPETIILSGDDDRAVDMIQRGAKGCISVIANLLPGEWSKTIHLALQGDFKQVNELYKEIKPLLWAIFLEVNPQGIKCALAKENLCQEVLRLPLLPVSTDTREEIYEALTNFKTCAPFKSKL